MPYGKVRLRDPSGRELEVPRRWAILHGVLWSALPKKFFRISGWPVGRATGTEDRTEDQGALAQAREGPRPGPRVRHRGGSRPEPRRRTRATIEPPAVPYGRGTDAGQPEAGRERRAGILRHKNKYRRRVERARRKEQGLMGRIDEAAEAGDWRLYRHLVHSTRRICVGR